MKTTVTDSRGTRTYDSSGKQISGSPLSGGSSSSSGSKTGGNSPPPNYAKYGYKMPNGTTAMVSESMKQQMITNAQQQGKDVAGSFFGISVPSWQKAINLGADFRTADRVARGDISLSQLPSLLPTLTPTRLGGYGANGQPTQNDAQFWSSFDEGIGLAGYNPEYKKLARESVLDQLDAGTYGQSISLSGLSPVTPTLPTATAGISTNIPSGGSYFGMSPEQYAAEIRRKESLGLALTNPQAAAAFKAANPGLFGAAQSAPVPTAQTYADLPIPRAMEYPKFRPEPYRSTGPDIRIADEQTSVPTLSALGQWHDQQRDAYNAQLGQYTEEQRVLENYLAQQRQEQQRQQELEMTRAELQREIEEQRQAEAVQRWQILGVADQTVAEVLGIPVGTPTNDASYRDASLAIDRIRASKSGSSRGSASTPKPTQTDRYNAATADAYSAVDSALGSGAGLDQIEASIRQQTPELIRQGVDPQEVIEYLYTRSADYEQQDTAQDKSGGSWYTKLDSKLGGWLPFGASR